jgi:diketogulonate reductase-like aldo/keto reductase
MLTRREVVAQFAAALGASTFTSIAFGATKKKPAGKAMLTRPVHASKNGESLPVIGMGTWNTFDVGTSADERQPLLEVLRAFYAAGASVIDSSPMYGNAESVTGDLIEQLGAQSKTFYATKVWTSGLDNGVAQIEQSMRRMRTPRLDLLQIHNLLDWRTHISTLRRMQLEGRVRYCGITHYTQSAYADLEAALTTEAFDFAQFNYSIASREAEQRLLPLCQERGISVLINRPFEEGELMTRVRNRKLPSYAKQIGCHTWPQFFLKFIISHPAVTCVIPATSRVEHMKDNLQAGFGPLPDAKLRERMARDVMGKR